MSDVTVLENRATASAHRFAPRLWLLVWLGLGLLIPGTLIPNDTIALAFGVCSSTVFALALVVIGLNRRYLASAQHFHESLDVFVHNDAAPTLFVNDDGEITYANKAARSRFENLEGQSLVLLLSDWSSNPVSVIFRLQHKARTDRSASEDIVTTKGHLRLSAHSIQPQGFVWRLEDLVELRADGTDLADPISLPMMVLNSVGGVLHMNRAMVDLIGKRISHIDRLFKDVSLSSHGIYQIPTNAGPVMVRAIETHRDTGRREVFLLPCPDERQAQSTTAQMFDELPVALMRLGPTGDVLEANRLARGLLHLTEEFEASLSDLVEGLGRPIGDWLQDVADGRVLNRSEVVQARRSIEDRYLQISLQQVVENGEKVLIAVLNDATELKTLEAQFVQSQKMQAIGQLAGGIAHDFNNLLTAISGYCDLLLLRHDEGDPDYGDLIQINQNANRAASLVNQLLAYSRKQNLRPQALDIQNTLSDLSHLLNRLLGEKVSLNVVYGPDLCHVRADKRQLEQVLMNLVVNARDAMQEGGEVTVLADRLDLAEEMQRDRAMVPPGQYLSIRVCDSGAGIPPENLRKIFEPFYTTKKTGEGTGLGLSMVYGIVKQTGGFVFVKSAPGQGCEFQVLLPADTSPKSQILPPDTAAKSAPRTAREDGVVLLVEDEAPVRAFAARALRMRGYTVHEAADAEEALALLEDGSLEVDVFVTDVIMPGMDGPTWVREAQKTRPDVRVVFVSGYAEESFADKEAKINNSVFLPKPFSLNDLTEKVRGQLLAA